MSKNKHLRLAVASAGGMLAFALFAHTSLERSDAADEPPASLTAADIAALKADIARLKSVVPDQSHTMADVASHFSNLWFAGQADNWPLAQFYSDETHSHLRWAVRVIPKRKDRDGREVDLDGILTAFEQTSLKDLDQSIKAKDKAKFTAAYKAQMGNCMACHRSASKEFIRLHIPERPDSNVVEFQPETRAAR
jgi:hypothetical protein